MKASSYTFVPMKEEDLPLLFRWASESHVRKWWDTESNWEEFRLRYLANFNSIDSFPFIANFEGKPIGYFNYWTVESDSNFIDLFPSGSVGTDQFIGEPEFIGMGHGTALVKVFSDWLLGKAEIPIVMTDPDVRNLAAIRCYEKAGFQILRTLELAEGRIVLMEKRK